MSLKDIFKNSFLESWSTSQVGTEAALSTMGITLILGVYIFLAYRLLTRKTFYSKTFAISLVGVALITAAIILTIQSSLVVSLGMVGALSIVRFRTAVKDPMDLMFLFWSISAGIICGAGVAQFAIILSLVLTVAVLVLDRIPVAKAPLILVVNATSAASEAEIMNTVSTFARHAEIKARSINGGRLELTVSLRTARGSELCQQLSCMETISYVSLLSHDGEVAF